MSFSRKKLRRPLTALALLLAAGAVGGCAGEYPQSIFGPVTELGVRINGLFALIFWLTMGVLVIVLSVLVYVVVRYRERPGEEADKVYGNNVAEILWTLAPAVIVAIILVPTIELIFDSYRDISGEKVVVEAIGHQWWWEYRYPEQGVVTANQLHLPVGVPVEVRTFTADVLHSWWVPMFGAKRDNFPRATVEGEERPNWHVLRFAVQEPGEYSGQCAEYCGLAHALMRTRVVVESRDEFERWLRSMGWDGTAEPAQAGVTPAAADEGEGVTVEGEAAAGPAGAATDTAAEGAAGGPTAGPPQLPDTLVERGYDVFTSSACVACHAVQGTPAQGRIGPDLTRFGERWSIGAGVMDNDFENLQRWITNPSELKPGAKMPGTRTPGGGLPPTGLSDDEVEAVAAYLLSLR